MHRIQHFWSNPSMTKNPMLPVQNEPRLMVDNHFRGSEQCNFASAPHPSYIAIASHYILLSPIISDYYPAKSQLFNCQSSSLPWCVHSSYLILMLWTMILRWALHPGVPRPISFLAMVIRFLQHDGLELELLWPFRLIVKRYVLHTLPLLF